MKKHFKALLNTSQYDFIRNDERLGPRVILLECNPNTCEILGLDDDQYLIKTGLGQELLDNRGIFLSKRAAKSFGGYADAQYKHLPLRDYENMWAVMHSVVKDYDKIGKRNRKKDDNHLNKHAMHLIRLFMMAVDILEMGEIRTNRRHDLELLLKIRNGGFQREDKTFCSEFYDLVADYESRLEAAIRRSCLPDNPDMEKVEAFVEYVNRRAVEGDF